MEGQTTDFQFALVTPRFVILPTPVAVSIPSYRALYARLHADASFTEMGFGKAWGTRQWTDEETRQIIETRDISRCWRPRGLGDFAVGLRPLSLTNEPGRGVAGSEDLRVIGGEGFKDFAGGDGQSFESIEWVGYAGVRDATTSLPDRTENDPPLPPWQEMVEVRYGVSPDHWGKRIATAAAEAVMHWAVAERKVRRFIAETESANAISGHVLRKLGFTLSGTNYFKDEDEVEWERVVISGDA